MTLVNKILNEAKGGYRTVTKIMQSGLPYTFQTKRIAKGHYDIIYKGYNFSIYDMHGYWSVTAEVGDDYFLQDKIEDLYKEYSKSLTDTLEGTFFNIDRIITDKENDEIEKERIKKLHDEAKMGIK